MQLERLDARVLPDAKVDWNVSGAASRVQAADGDSKPDAREWEGHHQHDFLSANYGADLAKLWEHLLRESAKHPAEYQAMLQFGEIDAFGGFARELMVLEAGSVSVSVANYYLAAATERPVIAHIAEVEKAEETPVAIVEIIRARESESDTVLAGSAASAGAASVPSARAETEAKLATAGTNHTSNVLNAASLSAAAEFQANAQARVEGEHALSLLTPNRMESPLVQMPTGKDLLVVPPSFSPMAVTGLPENAADTPAIPFIVSVADVEETKPDSEPQTEETPGFVSQTADLIARYTPFDSANVNENIERFLNRLHQSRSPQSAGWNVWKVAVISTAGAMGILSAEFIRRKRLFARVPIIRNLSQRLTRTKMA
jgi:hypothetical protein